MPTPDGLNISTLHGKFVEPNSSGTPLKGTLTFTPFPSVITFPDENVIVAGTETATLDDVTGEFTIDLISTDQAGENPTGWLYSVTEKLTTQKPRSYLIALPFTNGEITELADITPSDDAPLYVPVVGPPGAPGIITTINGHSAATVNLVAADVGALDVSTRGAANGVASLDGTTHVPVAQIPDISATYVTVAQIGAANGVAGLGSGGLVPPTQLDLAAATPTAIANTGAVGVATKLAREDHTHAGVALTGTQTVAGAKTWSGSAYFTGTEVGVGVTASLAGVVDVRTAAAATTVMNLQNTNGASTATLLKLNGDVTTAILLGGFVNGDTQHRIAIRGSGQVEFGPGNAARDVNFYRSAAGVLNSSGQLASDVSAPAGASHLTRKDYVDAADALAMHLAGTETVTGAKTFSGTVALNNTVTVGAAVNLTGFSHLVTRALTSDAAYRAQVSGDTNSRYQTLADGKILWGPGNAVSDVNLYRSGATTLRTDTDLVVGGALSVLGAGGVTFVRKPADTGRATTTLSNDPDLLATLAANATYVFDGEVYATSTDNTNGNFAFDWTIPSGASGRWAGVGIDVSDTVNTGTAQATRWITTVFGVGTRTFEGVTAAVVPIRLSGVVVTTSTGTFALQWARSGTGGTVTLSQHSWLRLSRVA